MADEVPASQHPPESMAAIVVESHKLDVETLIDRKIYTIAAGAQGTFGSLSDVLDNIPSVDVDATGIVSLRGDPKVLILVDGKPSTQFAGASAGDALQSMPAKDIERIEVLTNPPAQFKADGAAGVINIITRKQRRHGSSGSVQASTGNGGRYVIGADGSLRRGPLSMAFVAGYRHEYRERTVRSDILAVDSSGNPTESGTAIAETIRRFTPTGKLSADYAASERQSIAASVSWAERGGLRTYTELNDNGAPGAPTAATRRTSAGHDPVTDLDERLSFAQKLGRQDETLDVELHHSSSHQVEHYDYVNESLMPPSATVLNNLTFHEENDTSELGIDYVLPVSKTREFKSGYAFERDDYGFGNIGRTSSSTGVPIIDPALTNEFRFRQQIHALYASYQASMGRWKWLGGVRAEQAFTEARQLTDATTTSGKYVEIYPSLHVDRSLSERSTLSFGASRRVTRPDPDMLNPYVDHEYTPNLNQGNPHLRPQYTQSFEAGYGYEGGGRSAGLTGYYRLNRDSVTGVTEYLANGLSITTKTNLPRDRSAGVEFSLTGAVVPHWIVGLSGNAFHSQIDASALGIAGLRTTTGLNAKLKLDYRPLNAFSAQLTVTRKDKQLTPQGYVDAIDLVNLGAKYRFGTQLTALATVADLLNSQKFHRFSASGSFVQDYRRTVAGQIVYVGLVYEFGGTGRDNLPGFDYDNTVGR